MNAANARGRLWRGVRGPAEAALRAAGAGTARWRPPPEFLVIGGRRCGTTTLFYGLAQHPSFVPQVVSSRWIPLREQRKGTRWLDAPRRGGAWYRGHFATSATRDRVRRRTGAAITGEATPWYLFAPGTAARAANEVPGAKLVAVLRDPVRRAWSQFEEQRQRGHEPLDDFAQALRLEDDRVRAGYVDPTGRTRSPAFALEHLTYRRQSEYDTAIEAWLARFPRGQLLVVRSEDLYADVPGTLATVADFVGLAPFGFTTEHRNRASSSDPPTEVVARLRTHFDPQVARLEARLDQRLAWW